MGVYPSWAWFIFNPLVSLFSKMSFLGKLKTAIVGNPVLKEYELVKHVASAGPGLLWKVYNGIKKSTKQVLKESGWSLYVHNFHFRKSLYLYFTSKLLKLRRYQRKNVKCFLKC